MIDEEAELKRFKWILASGFTFLFSCFLTYGELKYAIWGKAAEGRITEVRETSGTLRRGPRLSIQYGFTDDGTFRSESDWAPLDPPLAESESITVEYLPGVAKSSRIAGRPHVSAILSFFGSLTWLGYSIINLAREANTPIARGPGRRSR